MRNLAPPLTPEEFAERFAEIHPALGPQEALAEANRCLFCFDAPCTNACPAHIDVPRFIKKIASGNLRGSALTILDANILGLSCARVCPVDVLCEGACVLHRYHKRPIEIGRLQRHAMDYFYEHPGPLPGIPLPDGRGSVQGGGAVERGGTVERGGAVRERVGRVASIGAGPASLACAAELRRRGYAVTLFDSRPQAGGLNTYGVAQYKFRPTDSQKEVDLVRSLGVEMRLGVEVGEAVGVEELEKEFDAIFIAVGLGPTQPLAIPGEELPGVTDALSFIADYKTTGTARVGRHVAIVGGGNTAIDAATAAYRLGAARVDLLYRRGESRMPAFRFEYELAKQDGVRFHWHTLPVAIHGVNAVESIECVRTGERLEPIEGSNFMLDCDMVIISIGQSRLIEFLARCREIELRNGCVVVDAESGQCANPRYFAGGDCVNGGREVVDAVAEGKRAARGIAGWLEKNHG